jgi:hypothetical protein
MKLEYIGSMEDSFRVINEKGLRLDLSLLPKGRYRITIAPLRRNKSLSQLGYLYGAVYPMFWKLLTDAGWEFESVAEVDAFCKKQFANREIVNRNTGEIISIPELKRDFKTVDMMTYIDKIRDYAAEYLGGYIPSPEEQMNIEL